MTLLDEAGLIKSFKGMFSWIDTRTGQVESAGRVRQLDGEVIPDNAAFVDNYISEVGRLHAGVQNTMLWRKWTGLLLPQDPIPFLVRTHGYACEWYRQSILRPTASGVGHRSSFERNSLGPISQGTAFYLQSFNPFESYLAVARVDAEIGALDGKHPVFYPTYAAYQNLSALGTKVEGVYLDGLQYAGNLAADFYENFRPPEGEPVYSGFAGSTPAFFRPPQRGQSNTAANWSLRFSLTSGAPQPQQLRIPMRANALTPARDRRAARAGGDPVFTLLPVHVPVEAAGLSFEYQITAAAPGDFMTMGIGTENEYAIEAKHVNNGEWNGSPIIPVSSLGGQDVQLVFALNGSNGAPNGTLSVRNVQFFIPPKPRLELSVSGDALTVSWPLSALDWTLETSSDLSLPDGWQPKPSSPEDTNYFHTMTFDISTISKGFFRLSR